LGDIWSLNIAGAGTGQLYHFQAKVVGAERTATVLMPRLVLIDPYAQALAGSYQTGKGGLVRRPSASSLTISFELGRRPTNLRDTI